MTEMGREVRTIDQEVVQIYLCEGKTGGEDLGHGELEDGGGVR
jgi:hypothetical protein